ncbi:MAG: ABC-2 family transporter protein [Clostridiales bacterium]|nr:ABC-2 family transporter protein [Clostridiales bacterium]
MKKRWRVFRELLRLRMSKLMMYRLEFFGPFFVDGSLFLIQLFVFEAIYSHVDTIGGLSRGDMIIFIGTFSMLNAVNMVFYFFGVNSIPEKIKSGAMDLYLTKPVDALFQISFESINPGSIPLMIFSLFLILYGIQINNIQIPFTNGICYVILMFGMLILYYDIEVIIRTISFFTISTNSMMKIEDTGLELCMKLPGTVMYGCFKVLFYVIMPYGIMATTPTKILAGTVTTGEIIYGAVIIILFTVFMRFFWKFGIRHYKSASS